MVGGARIRSQLWRSGGVTLGKFLNLSKLSRSSGGYWCHLKLIRVKSLAFVGGRPGVVPAVAAPYRLLSGPWFPHL